MKSYEELKIIGKWTPEKEADVISRIPERFKHADIEACPDFVKDYIWGNKGNKALYIHGPVGTGKTFCSYAIYKIFVANGVFTRVINTAQLLQDIRDDFKYSNQAYYESRFRSWQEFDGILILDDFGSEKVTDWTLETLYVLINKRYEAKRYTFFTSNYDLDQLAERIGDRIVSRIAEMCHVKLLDGADRRLPS